MTEIAIAQVEFFLVGGNSRTLDELMRDCDAVILERLDDVSAGVTSGFLGSGIKTTIRIRDMDGLLTGLAREHEACTLRVQVSEGLIFTDTVPGFTQWFRVRYHSWCVRRIRQRQRTIEQRALAHVRSLLRGKCEVAVERMDRSFRPILNNERHELLQTAQRACGAWFFILVGDNLYADRTAGIAKIM